MLPEFLQAFNTTLFDFQQQYPRETWSTHFRNSLVNDFSFYSVRIEDSKLQYGDTIRFLNNETVRGINFNSLLGVAEHQEVLKNVLDAIETFTLTEDRIKTIHRALMDNPFAWETDFRKHLVGNYRNIPAVGSREPFFENKEYVAHYNLEMVMGGWITQFNNGFSDIDNTLTDKHLLTRIAYFHNQFLNYLHPFADGNGRVCRIIIGAVLLQHNCPPIFPEITSKEEQVEYITTIVKCEEAKSDKLFIEYLAQGMTDYMQKRLQT